MTWLRWILVLVISIDVIGKIAMLGAGKPMERSLPLLAWDVLFNGSLLIAIIAVCW